MVDSNNILLDNSQHSNPKCPFQIIKSFSNPTIQERPRSNSHISFNCRPEFVPKPKPKPTDVNPSPMTLCRRITSTSVYPVLRVIMSFLIQKRPSPLVQWNMN